jgi:hypothetical protein
MSSYKGMIYPEIKGSLGGTPMQSAMLDGNNKAQLQATANSLIGGRIKRRHGGGITVPQFQNSNTSSANINNIIAQLARTSTQMDAYSVYDNLSRQMGGMRMRRKTGGTRRKTGGNVNWVWGCMSGGKKKSKRKSRSKKSRSKKV